jgi:hypothetical protein
MQYTRKNFSHRARGSATRGWKNEQPGFHQKTVMLRRCGKKCFLGSNKSFPICKKNTCKISSKGVYSAYIRARQYRTRGQKYRNVSKKANKMLIKMGAKRETSK